MRTYEKEQSKSVMFDGQDAQKLIQLRQEMDIESERICEELHRAYDTAERRFQELVSEYGPRFESVMRGSDLSGTPIQNIGFDYSAGEQHGVVFAKKINRHPLAVFLDQLRQATDEGPPKDSIEFENLGETASERWGVGKKQRETEQV